MCGLNELERWLVVDGASKGEAFTLDVDRVFAHLADEIGLRLEEAGDAKVEGGLQMGDRVEVVRPFARRLKVEKEVESRRSSGRWRTARHSRRRERLRVGEGG